MNVQTNPNLAWPNVFFLSNAWPWHCRAAVRYQAWVYEALAESDMHPH